ncbi:hypothetical protein ACJJTC_006459 [Scirpophaga incertulas]
MMARPTLWWRGGRSRCSGGVYGLHEGHTERARQATLRLGEAVVVGVAAVCMGYTRDTLNGRGRRHCGLERRSSRCSGGVYGLHEGHTERARQATLRLGEAVVVGVAAVCMGYTRDTLNGRGRRHCGLERRS